MFKVPGDILGYPGGSTMFKTPGDILGHPGGLYNVQGSWCYTGTPWGVVQCSRFLVIYWDTLGGCTMFKVPGDILMGHPGGSTMFKAPGAILGHPGGLYNVQGSW